MEKFFDVKYFNTSEGRYRTFRVFLQEGYSQWSYLTGSERLRTQFHRYLDALSRGQSKKRKPPGVLRVEEVE